MPDPKAWFSNDLEVKGWFGAEPIEYWFDPELYSPGVGATYTLAANASSYALTGATANLIYARRLVADGGTYALTGTAAGLVRGYRLVADPSSFVMTGTAANLLYNRRLVADAGTYALTGTDATLAYGRNLVADSGAYVLTGSDASLVYSGDAPVTPTVVISGKQAREDWEARQKWRKQAEAMLTESVQEPAPVEAVPEAIEIEDILPRLYEPVESLAELVADAKLLQLDEARALESAMAVKDVLAIAELAYLAEVAVQQEKDAIAAFLMFMD